MLTREEAADLQDREARPDGLTRGGAAGPGVVRARNWRRDAGHVAGFWLMGLLNNTSFVVMNAGAKEIEAGGVGLVYLCNVLPSLLVKSTVPLWFDLVGYKARVALVSALMAASFVLVASGATTGQQLAGVGVGSAAGALGETSFLAYSSRFRGRMVLTAWSSGTGFAGVFGYAWVVFFTRGLGASFSDCLLVANVLAVAYLGVFLALLARRDGPAGAYEAQAEAQAEDDGGEPVEDQDEELEALAGDGRGNGTGGGEGNGATAVIDFGIDKPTNEWGVRDRMRVVLKLWHFTVPLFVVYLAEYLMQAGTWAAVGFPITSKAARDRFYVDANWTYQVGVFLSRSSGTCLRLGKAQLWIMPALQVVLLLFFCINGVAHLWWNYGLLALALLVGCLGGAVYVHGFILISEHTRREQRELALGSASVADTTGIMLANLLSLVLQGCLYGANGITDEGKPPTFECGYNFTAVALQELELAG